MILLSYTYCVVEYQVSVKLGHKFTITFSSQLKECYQNLIRIILMAVFFTTHEAILVFIIYSKVLLK